MSPTAIAQTTPACRRKVSLRRRRPVRRRKPCSALLLERRLPASQCSAITLLRWSFHTLERLSDFEFIYGAAALRVAHGQGTAFCHKRVCVFELSEDTCVESLVLDESYMRESSVLVC